ncbi:hypothetical protein CKA32_006392 [Geitlerinema sp. FC II]|nr:hypothetical protein CKA32_000728 [Geitlerinema sp. FC II]PPT06650.1 hypothetical protein CKA32_005254 [Geitlerinema sp. FC II]PPT08615.1 hypothetical protein CKA32_006392 [Geitlerinema sp. FC II]
MDLTFKNNDCCLMAKLKYDGCISKKAKIFFWRNRDSVRSPVLNVQFLEDTRFREIYGQ